MKQLIRLLGIFLLNLSVSVPTYAKTIEQENVKFNIKTEELIKGDIHYAFQLLTPRALVEKFPEAIDLDSLSLIYENKIRVLLTKNAYVIRRPIGFFSTDEVKEEAFIKHLMGPQKVEKSGQDTFKITVPNDKKVSYVMKIYLDSDDITTLSNSRVVQAVMGAKKMDVISQGASSFVVKEYSKFTKQLLGSTSVTSYVPLQENSTLVITYQLTVVKTPEANEKTLKRSFLEEIEALKELSENYKVQ